ncbi:hypothetical protein RHMOL_Rhmol02G0107000 [Rhododendron molle]|uniref:Uncharacterized protein n=1 Tax=Rhododendron molle TaxID=49168 RepID=A0ACC0PQF7_RHOML|nr:hypothetical protein RHMOL_Rhmol02G0107000 [Rhododendron molle]
MGEMVHDLIERNRPQAWDCSCQHITVTIRGNLLALPEAEMSVGLKQAGYQPLTSLMLHTFDALEKKA